MSTLRNNRLVANPIGVTTPRTSYYNTKHGGVFIEPVQRIAPGEKEITLEVTLSRSYFRLLEVLQDDVANYLTRLIESHVQGLIKSAAHNARSKSANGKED